LKRISVDVNRCSGCRQCEMTCSFKNEGVFSPSLARITVTKEDSLGWDLPIVCWHCELCKAMENCPRKALQRNEEGLIVINRKKCTGCKKCSEMCVIGAIKLHPERNTPLICNLCGGEPLCVQNCPTEALTYRETEAQQPRLPDQVVKQALSRWRIVV
jgi:carbon-monoxide dehydrogenase iron sulfur subunit